jgi:hypothetical protein
MTTVIASQSRLLGTGPRLAGAALGFEIPRPRSGQAQPALVAALGAALRLVRDPSTALGTSSTDGGAQPVLH